MPVTAEDLRKLASLNLSSEQMAGVLELLASYVDADDLRRSSQEERRKKDRDRKREARQSVHGHSADIPRKSCGQSAGIPRDIPAKERSPIPPKENNTLSGIKNPPCVPPSKQKSDPEGFAEFWNSYPKRDGSADRKGAVKAFNAALKRTDLETILTGVDEFAKAMERRGKVGSEFIPQARTWLNGDRWNETYDEPATNDKESEWRAILERHAAPARS